jgi:hypothetical protein
MNWHPVLIAAFTFGCIASLMLLIYIFGCLMSGTPLFPRRRYRRGR